MPGLVALMLHLSLMIFRFPWVCPRSQLKLVSHGEFEKLTVHISYSSTVTVCIIYRQLVVVILIICGERRSWIFGLVRSPTTGGYSGYLYIYSDCSCKPHSYSYS